MITSECSVSGPGVMVVGHPIQRACGCECRYQKMQHMLRHHMQEYQTASG